MIYNQKKNIGELIRYAVVGLVNNCFGYLLFLIISYWGIEYKLAMSILYAVSTLLSFLGNWNWVFKHSQNIILTSCKFLMTYFIGYLINLFLLIEFADHLGYSYAFVQIIAVFIVAIFLFIMFKFIVFIPIQADSKGSI